MEGPRKDLEKAMRLAAKNGTNKYEELENLGWPAPEIRNEFLDMYRTDPELEEFLNERDMSCTNAELGLNADGTRDDD